MHLTDEKPIIRRIFVQIHQIKYYAAMVAKNNFISNTRKLNYRIALTKMNETIQSTEITTRGCINKHKHQWARRPAIQNQHFSSPRKCCEENNEKWVYLYHLHLLILFSLLMILNYKDSIDGK